MFGRNKGETNDGKGGVPTISHRSSNILSLVTSVIAILSLIAAVYFYRQSQYAQDEKNAGENEVKQVVALVGALMELPMDETPTVATVTDKDKLAEQPFFQKSENGDKVLIYSQSGRAILYRPSSKKIVDVTSVNIQQDAQESEPTANADPAVSATVSEPETTTEEEPLVDTASSLNETVKIALLNGSTKVGVTQSAEEKIKTIFPEGAEVVAKEKAVKNDYQGVSVIDTTGKATAKAGELAMALGGTIVPAMPIGEVIPQEADIVVIIGGSAPIAAKTVPAPVSAEKDIVNTGVSPQ